VNEVTVTLIVTAAGALAYWLCAQWKTGACGIEKLFPFAVNLVGAVAGVYMFVWAVQLGKTSIHYAAWAGITGVCMTFYMVEKIKEAVQCLFAPKAIPQTRNDPEDSPR
jgi:multidrug transporter EmrE-like cation transporter